MSQSPDIPNNLPILPVRGLVVFPHTAIPLAIGQERSLRLVDDLSPSGEQLLGLFAAKDPAQENPSAEDIQEIGTLGKIRRLFRAPDGTVRLLVQGIARIRVTEYTAHEPYLQAKVEPAPEQHTASLELEALMRTVYEQIHQLSDLDPNLDGDFITQDLDKDDPLRTIYVLASYIRLEVADQQQLLALDTLPDKLRLLIKLLGHEIALLTLERKIQSEAQSEIEKVQRDYYLREQLKAIQKELGDLDDQSAEIESFRQKIEAVGLMEEARREADRELSRLARLPTASAEYGIVRTYLDWLVALPWDKRSADHLDIPHARQVLEADHYGLTDIKARILEFLAVRKLRQTRADQLPPLEDRLRQPREGVILCFVGPPGVGKTSLGASIARALERQFVRMSLGGVRDEAEIRGFRRTYVGAMPGRIIQSLRRCETRNPVIMLDEIDKLGHDFRGDPAAALLEVLDPEQNHSFRDHYLDVAFDLSEVMFITTANALDTIPAPLQDRMEIIHLSGYTEQEKVAIARDYLLPRQIRENGLLPTEVQCSDAALTKLVRDYTREAGVRNLEREIGKIMRKIAMQVVEESPAPEAIDAQAVVDLLGHPKIGPRTLLEERAQAPGVAIGLAWTPLGGEVLFVEALIMPGKQGFQYTGQLGEVMQESARAAFSYIRAHYRDYDLPADCFSQHDIHLHVPIGAVPKDGPSAGVTMATALLSLLTGRAVRGHIAMTGEITLRGQVLPVGGIKDKVLAADRLGLDTVILPKRNEVDLEELSQDIRQKMTFILAQSVDDVLQAALLPADTLSES